MFKRPSLRGIGSQRPPDFDVKKEVAALGNRLTDSSAVVQFVNNDGWKIIRKEYQLFIDRMALAIKSLESDVVTNAHEIQVRRDYANALELMLKITDEIVGKHNLNQQDYEKFGRVLEGQGTR